MLSLHARARVGVAMFVVLVLVALALTHGQRAAASIPSTRAQSATAVRADGLSARLDSTVVSGNGLTTRIVLSVDSQSQQGTSIDYFIDYQMATRDTSGRTVSYAEGSGTIPASDFTGNRASVHLSTDTSRINPGVVYGTPGAIEIDWRDVSNSSFTSFDGIQRSSWYRDDSSVLQTTSTGQWERSAAVASGSVLGVTLAAEQSGNADIGWNHNVTITLQR